jgi:hypothetical protein
MGRKLPFRRAGVGFVNRGERQLRVSRGSWLSVETTFLVGLAHPPKKRAPSCVGGGTANRSSLFGCKVVGFFCPVGAA